MKRKWDRVDNGLEACLGVIPAIAALAALVGLIILEALKVIYGK